ncbi:DUF262 domain-containing protein [Exiguobacterium sp. s36]|uniref:DUF262 domain-containing protein n=1 Tax=Exiguobacterium sp. s36 TaxID=2751227 RepID=UPI001BE9099B|nr:DUF262 domain-containing protein [Exiguobacterium sp. s36]
MEALRLISINDIGVKSHFFVPSYQRGYRWDDQQVNNLLNDLYEFMGERVGDQFYCLQPVVVRKRGENNFEVIDGQQRLTTISILLQCLGFPTFSISYETRPKSQHMLASLKDYVQEEAKDVDHHYFKEAYLTIKKWIEEKQVDEMTIISELYITLGKHTKVIWYEIKEDMDVHELFMRLNIGKIPLTNAELIKASLLQPLFNSERQELALQWEEMEQTLQDDSFWYFIEPKVTYTNRIEFLFDIIVGKTSADIDPFHTFYKLTQHEDFWEKTRLLFARLREWYAHRETYHLIGYLLHAKTNAYSIPNLITLYDSDFIDSKEKFIDTLSQYVRATLPKDFKVINDYRYGTDNRAIQNVLLFFNILEEMRSARDTHRFPFDHYAKEHWSLEHIHAQKTEELNNRKQWEKWLRDALKLIEPLVQSKLTENIKEMLDRDFERVEFENMVQQVENELKEENKHLFLEGEDIHSVGNLALLDRRVNTILGNHYYPIKFEALKQHERAGGYVPPATRKAFWKYYSKQPDHFEYWASTDQQDYVDGIVETLNTYFKEGTHAHV